MTIEPSSLDLSTTQHLDRPMTAGELTKQALLVQEILDKVMIGPTPENRVGIHYGYIPGTPKPTLYQAGAEKLCSTFHLAPKYAVEDLSEAHNNFYRYRITCSLFTIRDGRFCGRFMPAASQSLSQTSARTTPPPRTVAPPRRATPPVARTAAGRLRRASPGATRRATPCSSTAS